MPSVIIIGASSGLGQRISQTYIRRGYNVRVAARRLEKLQPLVDEAPERVKAFCIDITNEMVDEILSEIINSLAEPPEMFINCAGIGFANPELDPLIDIKTVGTNCLGFTKVIDFIFNYYASNGLKGQIASISSVAGTRGIGIAASYSASKRFQTEYLTALSQLANQRKLKITITDIQPGFIDTPLLDSNTKYPMIMNPDRATALIVKAIDRHRHRAIIDCRWRMLVALWRRLPRPLWRHLPLHLSKK